MRLPRFVAVVGLLTALSLTWTVLEDGNEWTWPALVAAPVFNLAGAVAGFLFGRGAQSRQQLAGRIGAALSIVALLFNGLILFALYGLNSVLN